MEKKEDNRRKVHIWRPFAEARAFVRELELKSHAEWVTYCKSGKKPSDIPAYPLGVYRAEYQGTDDWLGTGRTRKFRSFTEARIYVRRLGLKSRDEWEVYCKSGRKPPDIPTHPDKIYWLEFESMGDWLGTGKPSTRNRKYRPFIEARAFVRKLELKSHKEWQAFCKSDKRPLDIPWQPWRIYTSEYKDMGDWLGVELTRHYHPFIEARAFVRELELKSHAEWVAYCKSGKKPPYIPSWPNRVYRSDYKGINDWLGVYRSFTEARAFVRKLELNTTAQWRAYCKSGKKPPDIPATPMKVYSTEYKSMGDWLGTTNRWDNKALLAFLFDLRPQLDHLENRELYDLLQQNGAFTAFRRVLGMSISPIRVLRDLKDNNGEELEQALRNTLDENIAMPTTGLSDETMADEGVNTVNVFENEVSSATFGRYSSSMEKTSDTALSTKSPVLQKYINRGDIQLSQQQEDLPEEPIVSKRKLSEQLHLLLTTFDYLCTTKDVHRRGYQLQDLLNLLFQLYGIPVQKSFTRNEGGEQIDGAFRLDGWHYLVECRWREKLADIRQLDGLYGQVGRSGKQTMGLFLSINGWSENVCQLLKQNASKSIILMDGKDLRGVLSSQTNLPDFLEAKIESLNLASEPFFGLQQYLEKKRTKRNGIF